jgi:outer membrane protein OmpA-like peptidoglycan-associated protein
MKTPKFFALVGLLFIGVLIEPTLAARLEQDNLDDIPNYVVIGAFSKQANAIKFTDRAQKALNLEAKYEMNPKRNLYYVYVLNTEDLALAVQEAKRLRAESEFRDTWVYRGSFTDNSGVDGQVIIPVDTDPVPEVKEEVKVVESTPEVKIDSTAAVATVDSAALAPKIPAAALPPVDDGSEGIRFLFKISRQSDMKRIRGDVDVIDVDRSRKMGTYKGNLAVKVTSPDSKSGKMQLVCDVFGYQKVQREINYNDPESGDGIIRDANGAVVIPFELTRLKKGDISVMYNVYFFKDAAIMRPESRYEVNSLLEMMKENPKYKIKIHGHTNGNAAGKIISMEKDSQNFFALTDTKEGVGTAKELSEERAKIIREYLISNGIDAKRMEIKAWGGKRPIHDKLSSKAQENVRVEIEILEDQ